MEKIDFPIVSATPPFSFLRMMGIGLAGSVNSTLVLFALISISVALSKNRWEPIFVAYAILLGILYGFPTAAAQYRSAYWPRRLGRESLMSALACLLIPGVLGLVLSFAVRRFTAAEIPYLLGIFLAGPLFFYFLNLGSALGEDKAARRVEELNDQAELNEFALFSSSQKARLAAIGKLEDQKLLSRIAQTNPNEDIQRQAMSQIRDQGVLAELILRAGRAGMLLNYPHPHVALTAIERISDRSLIERIFREAKDEGIRKSAASKLAI